MGVIDSILTFSNMKPGRGCATCLLRGAGFSAAAHHKSVNDACPYNKNKVNPYKHKLHSSRAACTRTKHGTKHLDNAESHATNHHNRVTVLPNTSTPQVHLCQTSPTLCPILCLQSGQIMRFKLHPQQHLHYVTPPVGRVLLIVPTAGAANAVDQTSQCSTAASYSHPVTLARGRTAGRLCRWFKKHEKEEDQGQRCMHIDLPIFAGTA